MKDTTPCVATVRRMGVVLDARDAAQAITEQDEKLYVIKAGRVVARNTRTHELASGPRD